MIRGPVYGYRPVVNGDALRAHFEAQGLSPMLPADDMHVTVVYSRSPYLDSRDELEQDWLTEYTSPVVARGGTRSLVAFGTALVLLIDAPEVVSEWASHRQMGASWDYPSYQPHVTLTYQFQGDPSTLAPYEGPIVLDKLVLAANVESASDGYVEKRASAKQVLCGTAGRGIIEAIMSKSTTCERTVQFVKADEEQRIVWGWASVATEKGAPVVDLHGDHIPMIELTRASTEFMLTSRVGKTEHVGTKTSEIVHSLPLSAELAKALGVETDREGWIIGTKVYDDATWDLVKSGKLPAFSIAGIALVEEV